MIARSVTERVACRSNACPYAVRQAAYRRQARCRGRLFRVGSASSRGREAVVRAARPPSRNPRSALPRIAATRASAGARTERRLDAAYREYAHRRRPAPYAAEPHLTATAHLGHPLPARAVSTAAHASRHAPGGRAPWAFEPLGVGFPSALGPVHWAMAISQPGHPCLREAPPRACTAGSIRQVWLPAVGRSHRAQLARRDHPRQCRDANPRPPASAHRRRPGPKPAPRRSTRRPPSAAFGRRWTTPRTAA